MTELPDGRQPIREGHPGIEQEHIRKVALYLLHRVLCVRRLPDHLGRRRVVEYRAKPGPQDRVAIGYDHPHWRAPPHDPPPPPPPPPPAPPPSSPPPHLPHPSLPPPP